jgi:hypothetical protein
VHGSAVGCAIRVLRIEENCPPGVGPDRQA